MLTRQTDDRSNEVKSILNQSSITKKITVEVTRLSQFRVLPCSHRVGVYRDDEWRRGKEGRKEGVEGTGGVTPPHTTLSDIALFTSL